MIQQNFLNLLNFITILGTHCGQRLISYNKIGKTLKCLPMSILWFDPKKTHIKNFNFRTLLDFTPVVKFGGSECRTLGESNLVMYPRIVRQKVTKEMEMMMTQPNNSKIEWKENKKMIVLVPVYCKS